MSSDGECDCDCDCGKIGSWGVKIFPYDSTHTEDEAGSNFIYDLIFVPRRGDHLYWKSKDLKKWMGIVDTVCIDTNTREITVYCSETEPDE